MYYNWYIGEVENNYMEVIEFPFKALYAPSSNLMRVWFKDLIVDWGGAKKITCRTSSEEEVHAQFCCSLEDAWPVYGLD